MIINMICFSLTGNTLKLAEAMAEAFEGAGHAVRIIPLKEAKPEDAIEGDLFGMGTLCLAGQAPTPVKDFLRSLPSMDGKRAFVFATSGESPGRVLYDQTRLLRQKGADVIGGFRTRGQYNYEVPAAKGRYPGRPDEDDLALARDFTAAAAEHVSEGRPGSLPESKPDALKTGWGFYDLIGLIATDSVIRIMMPKQKLDQARCDKCKLCAKECFMDNITLEPYPVVGKRCVRCYCCVAVCPREAFDVNWRLADMGHLMLYNSFLGRWLGDLEKGERIR
jgi:flavodoxin/ferredoxin